MPAWRSPRPRARRGQSQRKRPQSRARPLRQPNDSGLAIAPVRPYLSVILKKPAKKPRPAGLPSREDLLAFIGTHKGKAGVREVARAFGLKNADRAALRQMLRGLQDEGKVEARRKKLHQAGTLPSVVLADITQRDNDGELIAVPTEWDTEEHGEAPRIRIHVPRKARPAEIPGVGDRVLTRTEETGEEGEAIRHTGRVIKVLDRAKQRQLGIFRALPNG